MLLAAAPESATAADQDSALPLHLAAHKGHAAAVEVLLAAAPQAAAATDDNGYLALHWAAQEGHAAAVQLLLAAAPETASAAGINASQAHLSSSRELLGRSTASPTELLADLVAAVEDPDAAPAWHAAVQALLVDLAASRPLWPGDWAALPSPCPGLARALPAVLSRSPFEARRLVAHLPAAARKRLRALALSLARLQRRLRLELPEGVVRCILVAAPLEEERAVENEREEPLEQAADFDYVMAAVVID
eukprot:scaffold5.g676.t1